jgi:hypothetical protein
MTSRRSIEIKLGAQLLRRHCFSPSVGGEGLSGACVLVCLRRLIIKRRRRKGMQHWVITPTLDDHQRGLSLLLGKLIDQLVKSLLRSHRPMVPPARIESSLSAATGFSPGQQRLPSSRSAGQGHLIERRRDLGMGSGDGAAM